MVWPMGSRRPYHQSKNDYPKNHFYFEIFNFLHFQLKYLQLSKTIYYIKIQRFCDILSQQMHSNAMSITSSLLCWFVVINLHLFIIIILYSFWGSGYFLRINKLRIIQVLKIYFELISNNFDNPNNMREGGSYDYFVVNFSKFIYRT